MESFSLDSLEPYHYDCAKWSKDNHICIMGTKQLLMVTLPFQLLNGCALQRAKVECDGRSPIQIEWSPDPIDGYHQLAALFSDGSISLFAPRMNPAWNTWKPAMRLPILNAVCFTWSNTSIICGTSDGSVISAADGALIKRRAGTLPVRLLFEPEGLLVGWDDGMIELMSADGSSSTVINDDGIWAVGPLVCSTLFSKLNRTYMGKSVQSLSSMSPVTGMSKNYCGTSDGHLWSLPLVTSLSVDFDEITGVTEIPCFGFVAVVGKFKGLSMLSIIPSAQAVAVASINMDSLACERWSHCQSSPESMPSPPELAAEQPAMVSTTMCSFCGKIQSVPTHKCSHCGSYAYKLFEK